MSRSSTRLAAIGAVCLALGLVLWHVVGTASAAPAFPALNTSGTNGPLTPTGVTDPGQDPLDAANETPDAADGTPDAQDQELIGTVASVDPGHGTVTLDLGGGQTTVIVTGQTEFSDGLGSLADLRSGMLLKVDGAIQADGSVLATEIKITVSGTETPDSNG